MFLLPVLCLLSAGLDKTWQVPLSDIQIVNPQRTYQVAVAPNGTVLLRDRPQAQCVLLDSSGKLLKRFGGRGQGPGEFLSPEGLAWLSNDELLVAERGINKLHRFDGKGNFREAFTTKTFLRYPAFGPNRRIYCLKGDFSGYEPTVLTFDLNTQETRQIYAAEMEYPPIMAWDPRLIFASGDGFVVVGESNLPKLLLFDGKSGKKLGSFAFKVPRKILDEAAFPEEKLRMVQLSRGKVPSPSAKIEKNRPEFWPCLDQLLVDDQNRIWVFLAPG